jgi:TusA-related sulfurtransferase
VTSLDLTGVVCPLNWVKTRLALEELDSGEELMVRLDEGEAIESVPRSAREEGHAVTVDGTVVRIVKR